MQARDNGESGSDTPSEPCTVETNQQTLEGAVEKNSHETETLEPDGAITGEVSATEGKEVVSTPPSEPSGATSSVEKNAKDMTSVNASAEAPRKVEDTLPVKASVEAVQEATDEPAVKASVEAPKETAGNGKVAESSTKIVPDLKLDEAIADNTTDAKDVSPHELASVETPKEVSSVQKRRFAGETSQGSDTAAVLSTEEKTIRDERNTADAYPEKVTEKLPAVGVSYNVTRVVESSDLVKMEKARDSDEAHDSTSRKRRSAAKSAESDGRVVSKRKKSKSSVFG